jgi:hypothetical protein
LTIRNRELDNGLTGDIGKQNEYIKYGIFHRPENFAKNAGAPKNCHQYREDNDLLNQYDINKVTGAADLTYAALLYRQGSMKSSPQY